MGPVRLMLYLPFGENHTSILLFNFAGIIPRSAAEIFGAAEQDNKHEYHVSMSYTQIYMEQVCLLFKYHFEYIASAQKFILVKEIWIDFHFWYSSSLLRNLLCPSNTASCSQTEDLSCVPLTIASKQKKILLFRKIKIDESLIFLLGTRNDRGILSLGLSSDTSACILWLPARYDKHHPNEGDDMTVRSATRFTTWGNNSE